METYMIENVFLTGVVMALCQLLKLYINTRWIPLFALALGVLGAFGLALGSIEPFQPVNALFQGLISGLVAVGLYSGTKNTFPTQP